MKTEDASQRRLEQGLSWKGESARSVWPFRIQRLLFGYLAKEAVSLPLDSIVENRNSCIQSYDE